MRRRPWGEACPQVELVLSDIRGRTGLECGGVVSGHTQPMGCGQNRLPSPAVGLVTLNGTDVVGFSVVVLGDDLGNINWKIGLRLPMIVSRGWPRG